jgi:hypothetical protein
MNDDDDGLLFDIWAQSDIIRDIQTRQSGRGHRTAHRKADAGSPPPTRGPNCAQSVRQPETRWSPRVRCGPKRAYNNYLQSGRGRRGAVTCHCERPKRSEAVPASGERGPNWSMVRPKIAPPHAAQLPLGDVRQVFFQFRICIFPTLVRFSFNTSH